MRKTHIVTAGGEPVTVNGELVAVTINDILNCMDKSQETIKKKL
ncbi:hypothetical protein TDB9533_01218 [Thalassocella blandensis]|nr:hypothetical protein TDB9533_01218 [Thalassocella blandensis]